MARRKNPYRIRILGDPVLRERTPDVTEIDGDLMQLVEDMFEVLHESGNGIGLAAPQVGVPKRLFIYDLGDDSEPGVLINPVISGSDGEWVYSEGCLSIPGQYFEIVRPKQIEVTALDLDGNEITFEADELWSRLIQHELDHLDGVLMIDHLDEEQRKAAKKAIREMKMRELETTGGVALASAAPKKRFGLFN